MAKLIIEEVSYNTHQHLIDRGYSHIGVVPLRDGNQGRKYATSNGKDSIVLGDNGRFYHYKKLSPNHHSEVHTGDVNDLKNYLR
jgi:hypothetical protein